MPQRVGEVERLGQGVRVERGTDLGVRGQQLAEVALLLPGRQSVALHQPVRLVSGQAGCDERQQDALAEHEPVRRVEVAAHALCVDHQPVHERCEAVEHVVEREKGIGQDDALGARVGDVALVPEGDVLETHDRRRSDDPGEAADPLGDDRIALVRHRRRALLPAAERLLDLAELGTGEVADLGRETIE